MPIVARMLMSVRMKMVDVATSAPTPREDMTAAANLDTDLA
jgi:hypothetical protein